MFKLILLIVTILIVLLASHYAIYSLFASALKLPERSRRMLLVLLMVLSLTFPAGLILLLNGWDNGHVHGLYLFGAVWMGLAINLFMAAKLYWLLVVLSRWMNHRLPLRTTGLTLTAAALLFSAWGIAQALFPTVNHLEVRLDGLPDNWQGKRLVHLSDIHLGVIHGPQFMDRIVTRTNALEPELILITGDLFDAPGGDFRANIESIARLRARKGVYLVAGNHEIYNVRAKRVMESTGVRILDNEVVPLQGLQLVGIGYPGLSGSRGEQTLERIRRALTPDPGILLFHTPTTVLQGDGDKVASHFETYWAPDTSCAVNRELGIDLQLSGHTHAGQIFPFGLMTHLIYGGRDYGLIRNGPFQLYVSSGTGTFGPPMRTQGRSEIVAITLQKG